LDTNWLMLLGDVDMFSQRATLPDRKWTPQSSGAETSPDLHVTRHLCS